MADVVYAIESDLSADEFRDVLSRCSLGERRPLDDHATLEGMLRNAGVIATARIDGMLVGISRAITDFAYCTYLSDLAVDEAHQGKGIGRELIAKTHEAAGRHTTLILIAAPKARSYYPHIGLTPHDSCWMIHATPKNSQTP